MIICRRKYGENSVQIAQGYIALGLIEKKLLQTHKFIKYYKKGIAIYQNLKLQNQNAGLNYY